MYPKIILLCLLLLVQEAKSQDTWSVGASLNYNFPLQTVGAGIRARLPMNERLALVPKVRYAPSFNAIHEVDAGVNVQFSLWNVSESGGPVIYLSGGAVYNRWLNYQPSANAIAEENNILPELGGGFLSGGKRFKFFTEAHWNFRWNESYGDIGVLFYPSARKSKRSLRCYY